ncbi:MAG: LON peptidase substrate-binding domain-containing protein [Planctomycetes bacterium]|nr:LON peptidase substrate-binding domain-containing protein [Planctomycetota bacterium]
MTVAIQVNFRRPMPVFPLPEAVLLPHAVQPLHIIEPRYSQLVNDVLDSAGQIAVASFARNGHTRGRRGLARLRPAVCVGQIIEHQPLGGGCQAIVLQGVCRARILEMFEPADGRRYRLARLRPLESVKAQPPQMKEIREQLRQMLSRPHLARLRAVESVMQWFDRTEVSTQALLELIGFALLAEGELKYRLLAEANPVRRAVIIKNELAHLDDLVGRADRQSYRSWPKGLSWN